MSKSKPQSDELASASTDEGPSKSSSSPENRLKKPLNLKSEHFKTFGKICYFLIDHQAKRVASQG